MICWVFANFAWFGTRFALQFGGEKRLTKTLDALRGWEDAMLVLQCVGLVVALLVFGLVVAMAFVRLGDRESYDVT